jgi:hypothetical protein
MKNILFIILFLSSLEVYSQNTVKFPQIGIEVMTDDLGKMNWYEAKEVCDKLGDGWRLPTKDEFIILYSNRKSIGGFKDGAYWSSMNYDNYSMYTFLFDKGNAYSYDGRYYSNYVRAIRTIR